MKTFFGCIKLNDNKSITNQKNFIKIKPKGEFVFPLIQHVGSPSIPVVKIGDRVKRGQKIATRGLVFSSNIYSSVNGIVKKIEKRLTSNGDFVDSIVVELEDNFYDDSIKLKIKRNLNDWNKKEIIKRIEDAGIVGLGGAGFPTNFKFNTLNPNYIIINCAECEPYITVDNRLILEKIDEIIEGIKIILYMFHNIKCIIGIESNKKDCIKLLKNKTKDIKNVFIKKLKTKYPQGEERQLIYSCLNIDIGYKKPFEINCIVSNIKTIYSIEEAVIKGRVLVDSFVTISGDCVKNSGNYIVPIGMSYKNIIETIDGFTEKPYKIINGGPMMGKSIYDLNVSVTKTTCSILFFKYNKRFNVEETECINCSRCIKACPNKLLPNVLKTYAKKNDKEMFIKQNGMNCKECGCCSYVCPARQNITQYISHMKKLIIAKR